MTERTYTVEKDDNLYDIAKKNNVSFNELKAKNPQLKDREPPYGINPGDKITLPEAELSKKEVKATVQMCKICLVEELKIKCGHSERKIELTVDLLKHSVLGHGAHLVQVIAGSTKADQLTISLKGKCHQGNPATSPESQKASENERPNDKGYCPTVLITGKDLHVDQPSPVKVDVYSLRTEPCNEDFIDFIKKIMIPNSYPEVYSVSARTCSFNPSSQVTIHAFPQTSWSGKVAVGYSYNTYKDSGFVQNQGYKKLKVQGEWGISGEIEVKYDNRTWTLGGEKKKEGGHQKDSSLSRQLFKGAQGFLDRVTPMLGDLKSEDASIKIDWPKLELGGELKNKESTKNFTVGLEGSVKVGFSPLIGATFKIDILNWLIKKVGDRAALGSVLLKIKKQAEKGWGKEGVATFKAVIAIEFSIGAKIEGSLEWKVVGEDSQWTPAGELKGTIPIEIKGTLEVEGSFWILKAGGGAKIGAKTEVGASLAAEKTDEGPAVKGQLFFSGLTIYYAAYYELGASSTSSSKAKSKGSLKDEFSDKYVVAEPAKWPSEKKAAPLVKDGL